MDAGAICTLESEAPVAHKTALLFLEKFEGLDRSFTLDELEATFQQLVAPTRMSLDQNDRRNRKAVKEGLEAAQKMIRLAFINLV